MSRKDRPANQKRPVRQKRPASALPGGREFTAVHEAAHAVSAVVHGLNLVSVDIRETHAPDGRGRIAGRVRTDCPNLRDRVRGKGESAALPWMIQYLSGPFAERLINPAKRGRQAAFDPEFVRDTEAAMKIARFAICESTVGPDGSLEITIEEQQRNTARLNAFFSEAEGETSRFIVRYWDAIRGVAQQLLDRVELSSREVERIVAEHDPVSPVAKR